MTDRVEFRTASTKRFVWSFTENAFYDDLAAAMVVMSLLSTFCTSLGVPALESLMVNLLALVTLP